MKKSDLKNMMIVEMRSGQRWLVVGDMLYNESGHISLSYFTHDLRHVELTYRDDDIMRVYEAAGYLSTLRDYDVTNRSVLWERKEEKPTLFSGAAAYMGICGAEDTGLTIGRMYWFKDGKCVDDDGIKRPITDSVTKDNLKAYGFLALIN